ncbi:hypothetical protein NFI95_11650 [Acetobacteraceae bacterium KSS8]|uniref:Uncharacterized protein n=1 Tax=Endosaccharibacter trunci TaxID=2812733 RepID=A0ABT1W8N3_9PROT|nr:hypothetical protein [Acetobacteraceae bacterium KSS8]
MASIAALALLILTRGSAMPLQRRRLFGFGSSLTDIHTAFGKVLASIQVLLPSVYPGARRSSSGKTFSAKFATYSNTPSILASTYTDPGFQPGTAHAANAVFRDMPGNGRQMHSAVVLGTRLIPTDLIAPSPGSIAGMHTPAIRYRGRDQHDSGGYLWVPELTGFPCRVSRIAVCHSDHRRIPPSRKRTSRTQRLITPLRDAGYGTLMK